MHGYRRFSSCSYRTHFLCPFFLYTHNSPVIFILHSHPFYFIVDFFPYYGSPVILITPIFLYYEFIEWLARVKEGRSHT